MRRGKTITAAALALGLLASGCGDGGQDDPLARVHDLEGVPLSPVLAGAVADVRALLATPVPPPGAWPAMEAYDALVPRIDRADERAAAAAELAARLRGDPDSFLWHQLARTNRNLLGAHLDYAALRAAAEDARPSTRLFVAALYTRGRRARDDAFAAMDAHAPDLLPVSRCELVRRQAIARGRQGDTAGAVRLLLETLPAARAAGGARLEALLWGTVRRTLYRDDRLDDALHAACVEVALRRRTGSAYQELQARLELARVLGERGEMVPAFAVLDTCLADARALDHPWLLNTCLNQAAGLHAAHGDLEQALACDRESLALARAMDDSLAVPVCLANVAYDLRLLGRLDACRAALDEGRRWVAAYPHPDLVAGFPMQEVPYYLHVGDYATADSLLQAALGAAPGANLAVQEAELHLEQIRFALEMGRPDLAYRSQERLEDLRHALYDRLADANRAAEFALASAALLGRQGEFVRAAAALDEAADAVARGGGEGMTWALERARGELALLRGDAAAAGEAFAACLAEARAGDDPTRVAESRVRLGAVLLELGRAREARAVLAAEGDDDGLGPRFRSRLAARLFAAVALARTGRPGDARAELDTLVAGLRPHAPADLVVRAHLERARLCAALGDAAAAAAGFDTAAVHLRRADGRLFADELRLPNRELRRELVEAAVGFALDRGRDDDPRLASRTLALTDLARPAARPAAPAAGPQLRFFVGPTRSFRWWGRGDRLQVAALPGRDSLLTLLVPVVADVERPDHAPDPEALRRLASVLWEGLDAAWRPGETLLLEPDGVLGAVPWPALPLPPRPGAPPALRRGPMAEGPWDPGRPRRPVTRLLVLGDDRAADGGEALRHAEREAAAVASLWPAGDVTLRLGAEAGALGPDAWRGYDVVHLASHARFSEGLPRRATVRLAAGVPMTASAVRRLDLDAELVFLSCCEAAQPLSVGGLGSFARACLDAGAGAVIASGLRVDDAAAADLATRFYRHWQRGLGKAAALHAARRELVAEHPAWAHPYYWAGYRLIGDPR